MRTTIDLPDELLRRARMRAAQERTTLTTLLADGLQLRLAQPNRPTGQRPLPVSSSGGGLQTGIDPTSTASLLDAADRADAHS